MALSSSRAFTAWARVCRVEAVPEQPASRLGGTFPILGATVVAGVGGYLIMLIAPARLGTAEYTAFAVFWSATYFVTASLAAVQNEISRASSRVREMAPVAGPSLRTFTLGGLAVALVASIVIMMLAGPALFGDSAFALAWPFVLGVAGYVLAATIGGALFGLHLWNLVGLAIIADTVIRVLLVVPALLLGADAAVVAWLVAVPFVLAPLVVWPIARTRIVGRIRLDVGYRRLVGNIALTLPGSVAAALIGTGLPAVVQLMLGAAPAVIAPLIFALTIGRAPVTTIAVSLQAFLIVRFRDGARRRVVAIVLAVFGFAVVAVATLAWAFGPWLVGALSSGRLVIDGTIFGLIVLSGGSASLLYVTGAALLARQRHQWQSFGWVVAAVVVVVILVMAPFELEWRLVVALLVGPVVGLAVHVLGLIRRR